MSQTCHDEWERLPSAWSRPGTLFTILGVSPVVSITQEERFASSGILRSGTIYPHIVRSTTPQRGRRQARSVRDTLRRARKRRRNEGSDRPATTPVTDDERRRRRRAGEGLCGWWPGSMFIWSGIRLVANSRFPPDRQIGGLYMRDHRGAHFHSSDSYFPYLQ